MRGKQPMIEVALKLTMPAHQRLFEAAKARGYTPSVYAQLLFDAAFAARVGRERGDPIGDRDLDQTVRLVFACAGQGDTDAIARATGVREPLVAKILDGWKQAGRGQWTPS